MSVWRGGCAWHSKNVLMRNNTQSVVSMLQLVGWSVKEKKRHSSHCWKPFLPVCVVAVALYALTLVGKQPICWNPSPRFLPPLVPTEERKKKPPWVTFYLSVCCRGGQVSSSSVPSLWGTGSCFLNRLPWRTWGGTVSSLLIWRAQLIWLWNRGQHGKIHPEETKH